MRIITLTNGQEALVSDCDYTYLQKWQWGYMTNRKGSHYARSTKWPQVLMHTLIARRMRLAAKQIDHRNRNTLDNRRSNLRDATHSQNHANEGLRRNNTSGFKGVTFCKQTGRWIAHIHVNYKNIWLGRHDTPREAAIAYNKAAQCHFGQYARLNKV